MKPPAQGGYLRTIVLAITSVISALIPSVTPLRAQSTYYRVHYPEFLAIVETFSSIYSEYIIAIPEFGEAMPQLRSESNLIIPKEVPISDDKESITVTAEDEELVAMNLESIAVSANNRVKSKPFYISYPSFCLATSMVDNGPKFVKKSMNQMKSSDGFRMDYDETAGNDGMFRLKSSLKSGKDTISIVYSKGTGSKYRFRLEVDNESKQLSLYRKDYFNIRPVDKENPIDKDNIIGLITDELPDKIKSSKLDYYYIFNDGDAVTHDDLLNSANMIANKANKPESDNIVSVPYDGISKVLWLMPVIDGSMIVTENGKENIISKSAPVGRIVKIEVAKGGDTTGIDDIKTDGTNHIPQYFTIQGRPVNPPLAPGIYIKREGDKSTKILVK